MTTDRRRLALLAAAGSALLSLTTAWSKPPEGKGKPDKQSDGAGDSLVSVSITTQQARRYAENCRCTGYSALPPGIRKNLARGKPLPPGIAKKVAPQPMLSQLPAYAGYQWQVAGSDLVLVAIVGGIVAAVLSDVFR
jgi:hypothetical protein